MKTGARGSTVGEPLGWYTTYPIQWRDPRVDLAELAKLRWIEGLSRRDLAQRYGRTEEAVQNYFQALKRREFRVPGLAEGDRKRIVRAAKARWPKG